MLYHQGLLDPNIFTSPKVNLNLIFGATGRIN